MAFDIVYFYREIILNKIVTALIIFFVGFMLGKIAGSLSKRILEEANLNKKSINTFLGRINLEKLFSNLVSYLIYLGTIIMALNTLGITRYVALSLLISFAVILVSTLVLDIRDMLPNLYSYLKIKSRKYFCEQDWIKTHLAEGTVKKITPFTTRIITSKGDELYIQNFAILENLIVEKKKIRH